jgi:hypothetical protein
MHSFLIYDNVTEKAYCKDIIVDLNTSDPYPEYPQKNIEQQDEVQQKKTRANVWRKWKDPTETEMEKACLEDTSTDFDPSLFLKNPDDVERCKELLLDHFDMIQIAFITALSNSGRTFPEIAQEIFIQSILNE